MNTPRGKIRQDFYLKLSENATVRQMLEVKKERAPLQFPFPTLLFHIQFRAIHLCRSDCLIRLMELSDALILSSQCVESILPETSDIL